MHYTKRSLAAVGIAGDFSGPRRECRAGTAQGGSRSCATDAGGTDALKAETPARLERMCEAASVELGRPLSRDEARLRADYDLTRREILRRLKAEREAAK